MDAYIILAFIILLIIVLILSYLLYCIICSQNRRCFNLELVVHSPMDMTNSDCRQLNLDTFNDDKRTEMDNALGIENDNHCYEDITDCGGDDFIEDPYILNPKKYIIDECAVGVNKCRELPELPLEDLCAPNNRKRDFRMVYMSCDSIEQFPPNDITVAAEIHEYCELDNEQLSELL